MKSMGIAISIVLVIGAGALLYAWTGWYHIGATVPHWDLTSGFIEMVRDRSIVSQSGDIRMPDLDKAEVRSRALPHYQEMCRYCHGAPGYGPKEFASGLYPLPPEMTDGQLQEEWNSAQIYWIIKHGIKMTGMPAFGPTHTDRELWGLVALTEQMPRMTPDQYEQALEQISSGHGHQGHSHGGGQPHESQGHDAQESAESHENGHQH